MTRPTRILLVEDNPATLKILRGALESEGYSVDAAPDARTALAAAARSLPDLVLQDLIPPDMDGFELVRHLRALPGGAKLPILGLSGFLGRLEEGWNAEAGFTALLVKPIPPGQLLEVIRPYVKQPEPPVLVGEGRRLLVEPKPRTLDPGKVQLNRVVVEQQNAHQAAQLTLLSGVAGALTLNEDIDIALRDVLTATLDAAGISKGALFLKNSDGTLCVRQAIGFSIDERAGLEDFFGRTSILADIIERGSMVSLPSPAFPSEAASGMLSGLRVTSAQIVPLVMDGHGAGAMIIGATHSDMTTDNSVAFARAMCNQLIQSLALAKSVGRLTASEARYRALLDSATDAIAILTPEGVIREANHRWEEILGLPRAQLVGRHIRDFAAPGEGAHDVREHKATAAVRSGRMPPFQIARPDGSTVLMEFSDTTVEIGGERVVFTVGRDVTRQRMLEQQLRQSQQLEAVGRLAGGVAHDFNNVLTAIIGFCELLVGDPTLDVRQRRDVSEIRKAADRATRLTQQLLAFSRRQILQPKVLDINALIGDLGPMLRRLVFENIELVVSPRPATGLIRIDPTQFEQILVNLIVNSRDAMAQGGKLTIETSDVRLDAAYQQRHLPVVPGHYVMLAVSDTGAGMDIATRHRIFEPFFTTKGAGKGTGLGLATVYGIVKQSDGYIWVYSEPGRGTTFKIYFPRVLHGAASAKGLPAESLTLARGWETIFVVEDDEGLRRLARRALESSGYRLLEAGNPREAVQTASEYAGPIHLLLSDVVMPESEGAPLFDRLAAVRPGLRVLYMSGYPDETIVHHGVLEEGVPFLQKPFTPQALARKVRDVLDAPSASRSI